MRCCCGYLGTHTRIQNEKIEKKKKKKRQVQNFPFLSYMHRPTHSLTLSPIERIIKIALEKSNYIKLLREQETTQTTVGARANVCVCHTTEKKKKKNTPSNPTE